MVVYFGLILAKKTSPRPAGFEIIWESHQNGFFYSADAVTRNC